MCHIDLCTSRSVSDCELALVNELLRVAIFRDQLHLHLSILLCLPNSSWEVQSTVSWQLVHKSGDDSDALLVHHLPEVAQGAVDRALGRYDQILVHGLSKDALDAIRVDITIIWGGRLISQVNCTLLEWVYVAVYVHVLKVRDHWLHLLVL